MGPRIRKTVLVVHVLASVGWFGAVAAFIALAVAGLGGGDAEGVAGVYAAAQVITWYVILPLGILSFISGIVQGLGTQWGLVRYWWVFIKLVLTTGALALLVVHIQVVDRAASHIGTGAMAGMSGLDEVRLQLVVDSAGAVAVLVITTLLSVVKPRGRTPFRTGERELNSPRVGLPSR
jgi:uncharacterized membrane protein